MANLTKIPPNEQEGVLGSMWLLLRECEAQADGNNDRSLKVQVEGIFKQWNRITGQDHVPSWVQRKATQEAESSTKKSLQKRAARPG